MYLSKLNNFSFGSAFVDYSSVSELTLVFCNYLYMFIKNAKKLQSSGEQNTLIYISYK